MIPPIWRWALASTAALLALRLWLAGHLGFADAEALYACYALHPQPAYLDHPGLVGSVMRLVGGGTVPSPAVTHRWTAFAATALPWGGALAARATGASGPGALRTYFALALVPEIAIGLFAMNPDLLLAFLWLGAIGLGGLALRSRPGTWAALLAMLGAGACAALATLSKVTGVLLVSSLLVALVTPEGRAHAKTAAPWLAALLAGILIAPLVVWEIAQGFPMLRHRLIATQSEAGLSLGNFGRLLGGQLLYVTPPFLVAAWRIFKQLPDGAVTFLLRVATILPGAVLAVLCLWSRVAEPHWVAPAYLALAIGAAHVPPLSRALRRTAVSTGVVVIALSALYVGTPLVPKHLGSLVRPRYDLANDLYAWEQASVELDAAIDRIRKETGATPVVVGPHWIVCAQVHARLGPEIPVGCRTPLGDDFERWLPAARWHEAAVVLFVSDSRFAVNIGAEFPDREIIAQTETRVLRGGVPVRSVTFTRLERALQDAGCVRDLRVAVDIRK